MVENFVKDLKEKGIELNETMVSSFDMFYKDLVEENKTTNLTRITSETEAYYLHFYDSLMVSLAISNKDSFLLDVGTGPGFPGIPLKIAFPSLNIQMVEATNKKVEFVKKEIERLNLSNINIIHSRAEDFDKFETYDYVTLRAVAPLKVLLEYTIPFLKINGKLIVMKAIAKAQDEIVEAKGILKTLNSEIVDIIPYDVLDRKYELIVIEKKRKSPKGYPKVVNRKKQN
ncbi:MAG: 16S rRNA (guanine(527)-N(7))-methyltransferase RsmG [Gammaproteobacteria bacterium]|nr:16S rRNA (guanine(527)-N(7))-methyltransferase RsmG [Gammaproteobacteria bacterium]